MGAIPSAFRLNFNFTSGCCNNETDETENKTKKLKKPISESMVQPKKSKWFQRNKKVKKGNLLQHKNYPKMVTFTTSVHSSSSDEEKISRKTI